MTLNGQPVGSTTGVSLPTGAVTFLFTDIVGSTRLLAALADQYESVLGMHPRVLRTAIAGHGGATTPQQWRLEAQCERGI